MDLSKIKIEDIRAGFDHFYNVMIASDHFRDFFESQAQVDALVVRQADNFYQSLSMNDLDFQKNYVQLGLMHAKLKIPFEDIVSSLKLIRDHLIKDTPINPVTIYNITEKMGRYLAKGYLSFQYDCFFEQLEVLRRNIQHAYKKEDQAPVMKPLSWLVNIITQFKAEKILEYSDIKTADKCPLTPVIQTLECEKELKERILSTHDEQHKLALSMAYFLREEDYMLANFSFGKLFIVSLSLSNQIGLAVSHQAIAELHYDELTGLLLRHSLNSKMKLALTHCQSLKQSGAILMLDLDHFKNINDTWGHSAGDKVLEAMGKLIQSNQREHDFAFRYGGEEFLLFVSNLSQENALKVAERICRQVEALTLEWEGELMPLTLSIGGVFISSDKMKAPLKAYIEQADQHLYEAKDTGRNKVILNAFDNP